MISVLNHRQLLSGNNYVKQNTMNILKFLAFLFSFSFMMSCGQQKRYISYKMKEGETIDQLAKRLDISKKELLRLNPDINENTRYSVVIIPNPSVKNSNSVGYSESQNKPVVEAVTNNNTSTTATVTEQNEDAVQENPVTTVVRNTVEYVTHIVEKGNTVYSLTKKYAITKDELIALNPEFPKLQDNVLSLGQVLKVKKIEKTEHVSLEEDIKGFLTHTVQPKETLYSLTRFYNITKEQLIALNTHLPKLENDQLQVGDVLKIKVLSEEDRSNEIKSVYKDTIAIDRPLKVAFLLPLRLKKYDSVGSKTIFNKNSLANMVTDFYLGAELAVDSLRTLGVDTEVKVFDTGVMGKNVTSILSKGSLDDQDVVIGPFYSDKAKLVSKEASCPVVFPHFSSKQSEIHSSKLVKTSPDVAMYIDKLSFYLKELYTDEHVFIVGDGSTSSNMQVQRIKQVLIEHDSIQNITVLKPNSGKEYIEKKKFTDKMKPKQQNWVIMATNNKITVSDVINSMIVLPEDVTVQVFAVNKNDAYNSIDNNKLAKIGFAYVSNHYVNEDDAFTSSFFNTYRTKNFATPTLYALKGFDITFDVLMRLASDKKLHKTFDGVSIRVANKFNYESKLFNATDNKGLFIVKLNEDLSLERLQ